MKIFRSNARWFGAFILLGSVASAQVLMLDFGPTTAADGSRLSSPYHSANTSFTHSSWNKVGVNDVTSGLLWSNGNSAGAVSVDLGATTTDGATIVVLSNTPSNGTGLTGTAMSSGVYANSAPARDGIFTGSGNSASRFVGIQVGGLAAGTYDIYMTGRNTNTTAGHVQNFYAGVSEAAGDFDTSVSSVFATKPITYFASPTLQNDTWQDTGGLANYAKFTVTLGEDEFLNLAVRGGTGEQRGFLNAVQIVAVPEPASAGMLAGVAALIGVVSSRRRAIRRR